MQGWKYADSHRHANADHLWGECESLWPIDSQYF